MEARENILQELQGISEIVAGLGREQVFNIPAGYFDRLPSQIMARINADELVSFGEKKEPFSLPAGYFEQLPSAILDRIRSREQSVKEELEEIAPLLNNISRTPVYSVPEGYFESLELTIPLKLDRPSAKVFNFGKPKRILQYAVAACAAGILMVGAYLVGNRSGNDDMISYKEAVKMNVAKELDALNETDIVTYLEETPTVGYALYETPEEPNFDEYLDAASDEEINQYLNESAEPEIPVTGS